MEVGRLTASGEVEILIDGQAQKTESRGGSFGKIALIRDVPRMATVRATCATSLLTLEREQFIAAVTGQARSRQVTDGDRRSPGQRRAGETVAVAAVVSPDRRPAPLGDFRHLPGGV
jgi:CRP-like cAMP-binding protein